MDTGSGIGTGSLAVAFDKPLDQATLAAGITLGGDRSTGGVGLPKSVATAAAEGLEEGEVVMLQEGGASREVVMAALEKMLNPPQWPPSFQEAGAAYTFDAASG